VKLSCGEAVLDMILNGLGFKERRMYQMSKFFSDKSFDLIFGDDFELNFLNDDVLGRTLDAIAKYGCSRFFTDIALKTAWQKDLIGKTLHLDTTSISFYGLFKKQDLEGTRITRGHSKDKRPDLPQLVLSMIVSGRGGLPIHTDVHSGNENDRELLPNVIDKFEMVRKSLYIDKDFIYVADSALYSKKYLLSSKQNIKWITRVPESLSATQAFLEHDKEAFLWTKLKGGYYVTPISHAHKGIKQRWVLVFSRSAYHKDDAIEFIEKFIRHHPLFKISYKVLKESKRHRVNHRLVFQTTYKVQIIYSRNNTAIQKIKNRKGRFILATNTKQDELPLEQVLSKYHGQNKVESCFKFIKHKSFMAKDFYLKKPERIQALLVVMALTLFIYSLGQFLLRQKLRNKKTPIDNQIGHPTFKPTLRWAFQLLSGINWMRVEYQNKVWSYLSDLTKIQRIIIECFPEAKPFYGYA
jgi:transposase